jgi:eukaryotic-like serine/threonine-protein kinase
MGLAAGTRIGPYEVVSTLGSGGMGDVYRARDPRLGRDVAIKALPERLAADEERVARFRREAHVLASLNHPQIAAIYGLEEVGAAQFLVLELVEGETLAQRLASGPLALRDALVIAAQIAAALEAAHEKGIVHRDLKPANVGLTSDARVKVLDFGLAKTLASPDAADAAGGLDMATVTASGTRLGVVLGTAAYMSPEQARGLPIDKQTDIWAFGCVLYEMVAGRRAFPGQTTSDAIAGILEREPDWQLIPAATPPRVLWLLQRCLAKVPDRRLHDIADARIELEEALSRPPEAVRLTESPVGSAARTRERVGWAAAALFLAGLTGLLVYWRGDRVAQAPAEVQTYSASVVLPEGIRLSSGPPSSRFTLSPDGRRLALVAVDSAGRSMLYVRPLDSRAAQPLGGTEGAQYPFWSPDSRFVAFVAKGKLKKVEAGGGDVITLCDAAFNASGTWNRDDVILFTPKGNSPLFRVPARSGTPVAATTLVEAAGEVQHSYPFFLPDGRHFLYFVVGSKAGRTVPRGVYVAALDTTAPGKLLVENATNAKYANGHLIFLRDGTLLAQPFDTERLETRGDAVPLGDQVQATGPSASDATGAFTVSDTGVLAYQTGSQVISQLTWYDRKGVEGKPLGGRADYIDVAISPDGTRVATSVIDRAVGTRDLWIFDVGRNLGERFSFDPGDEFGPNWSQPRGDRIFFSALRRGSIHLFEKLSTGSASESLLYEDELGKFNPRPSPDSRHLIYVGGGGVIGRSDLWVLPRFGDGKAAPFIETQFVETQAQFSPDGRWVAFTTNRSGRAEVYVTEFPERKNDVLVSTAGGWLPRWHPSGREIFYLSSNQLTAVEVDGTLAQFKVGSARPLFTITPRESRLDAYPYDVAPDGERFLVNKFLEELTPPITLLINWPAK